MIYFTLSIFVSWSTMPAHWSISRSKNYTCTVYRSEIVYTIAYQMLHGYILVCGIHCMHWKYPPPPHAISIHKGVASSSNTINKCNTNTNTNKYMCQCSYKKNVRTNFTAIGWGRTHCRGRACERARACEQHSIYLVANGECKWTMHAIILLKTIISCY